MATVPAENTTLPAFRCKTLQSRIDAEEELVAEVRELIADTLGDEWELVRKPPA